MAPAREFEFLEYTKSIHICEDDDAAALSVKRPAFWSYCGPVLEPNENTLPPTLHEWVSAALTGQFLPRFLPLLEFARNLLAERGLDHYWLTVRATTATSEYDKPRWHTDDMFFSPGTGGLRATEQQQKQQLQLRPQLALQTDWKMCATLLGPSTMFIPAKHQRQARRLQSRAKKRARAAASHTCDSIRCVGCAAAADAVRDDMADALGTLGTVRAGPGECVRFRIGHGNGAVHSEPRMSGGPRVFVNVVPGTHEELGALVAQWGMEFPRAWWISGHLGRETATCSNTETVS